MTKKNPKQNSNAVLSLDMTGCFDVTWTLYLESNKKQKSKVKQQT